MERLIHVLIFQLVIASASAVEINLPATTAMLQSIDSAINEAVNKSKIPGGVIWLEKENKKYHKAYGHQSLLPVKRAMKNASIFDAASLTKVMATAPSIMILIEQGRIALDDPVRKHLPEFNGGNKNKVTIKQLLTHTSGLRPVLPKKPAWKGYDEAIKLGISQKLVELPGKKFRYSDINFILLGEIVRRVSGKRLDRFSKEKIFQPLQMVDTNFKPSRDLLPRIAPTTREGNVLIHGVVHDPAARAMGGVAGHAGLFTTAPDVALFCRMIISEGKIGNVRILNKESVALMCRNQTPKLSQKVKRGIGWDIDSIYSSPRGEGFPIGESFGHTGWTGGSVWIHPKSKSFLIFLSNRNHPYERRSIKPLRRELGTLSGKALGL
ncbi:MAG: serine hydrolase domain-containing protein [Verrucomicrobiota bacterium]|nr:serine hydrolase domain-containing protein [Verrucomicrobiota bacterium]